MWLVCLRLTCELFLKKGFFVFICVEVFVVFCVWCSRVKNRRGDLISRTDFRSTIFFCWISTSSTRRWMFAGVYKFFCLFSVFLKNSCLQVTLKERGEKMSVFWGFYQVSGGFACVSLSFACEIDSTKKKEKRGHNKFWGKACLYCYRNVGQKQFITLCLRAPLTFSMNCEKKSGWGNLICVLLLGASLFFLYWSVCGRCVNNSLVCLFVFAGFFFFYWLIFLFYFSESNLGPV